MLHAMTTTEYQTFAIDVPDDEAELEISHAITIGTVSVRVLKEPHQYKILNGANDPLSAIRAFIHPDDWVAFDRFMSGRKQMDDKTLTKIFNALVEKPTGHPTGASPASSDT